MSQVDTTIHPDALELAALLEPSWPRLRSAFHLRPTLVCDEETEEEKKKREEEEAKKREEEESKNKPPWGDDEDFDPKRAWKLIQDVRSDLDKVKSDRDEARAELKKRDDESKSDEEKREERASTAEKEAADAKRDAARLRVALKKGLSETQAKRLVGESEEDLEKDADELLESFKSGDDPKDKDEPRRRPRERLRPGAAPDVDPDENDPAKLADAVPRGY